jgi:hypothetical protein
MVAVIELVMTASVVCTITAIMAAHHTEERLLQRFTKNGNKYHRIDQKSHRIQARLARRKKPTRHYCVKGCALD